MLFPHTPELKAWAAVSLHLVLLYAIEDPATVLLARQTAVAGAIQFMIGVWRRWADAVILEQDSATIIEAAEPVPALADAVPQPGDEAPHAVAEPTEKGGNAVVHPICEALHAADEPVPAV